MTIQRLTLRNFRKWKKLTLELSPTVNVLVGPTDCGKSAVLGALRWVCLNQPDGDSFIRWGSKSASVVLETDDATVERSRGRDGNVYLLNGNEYVSFGRGKVPDDVANALNVSPLSFQKQHSAPYWLSLSAGEVSRELNSIVNLDLIDKALANSAAAVRHTQAVVKVSEDRLESAAAKLGSLGWVVEARKEWELVEGLHATAEENSRKASLGAELLGNLATAAEQADRLSNAILCGKQVGEATQTLHGKQETLHKLKNLVDKLGKLSAETRPVDLTAFNRLQESAKELNRKRVALHRLRKLLDDLQRAISASAVASDEADVIRQSISDVLRTNGCPLCGAVQGETCRSH
jgi:exonuclease SbcC